MHFFPSLLLFFLLSSPAIADPLYDFCGGTRNFTANSTYNSNLNSLLANLTTNTTLFSTASVGQVPNQAYGLALCRGDQNATTCQDCLATASEVAQQLCPYDRGATVFYDYCLLRYSNQLFLSSFDNSQQFYMLNVQNASDADRFKDLMNQLLNSLASYAAVNSTDKFATGVIGNYTKGSPFIYGLVQCTPDMKGSVCLSCLRDLFGQIPGSQMNGKLGGRFLGLRCNFRYEIYSFYLGNPSVKLTVAAAPAPETKTNATGSSSSLSSSSPSGNRKTSKIGLILGIAIPLVVAALLVSAICICFWRRRKSSTKPSFDIKAEDDVTSFASLLIDPSVIRTATANFSDENKLGEGGFGAVYKGSLPDGREIAVKKLLTSSDEGLEELKNELFLVAKLQHRNLVRLFGVSMQDKLLVYEYVPNRSLDIHLFDPEKRQTLTWDIRHKIINGIAKGLQYLHEESQVRIIHRDLKASNVLLDLEMNPKITDFGLAKLFGGDQTQGNTSRIVGTYGYMAPEYAMRGHFSNKSDVYSFGVLVLEIVTGRKNNAAYDSGLSEDLINYIWEKWSNGSIFEIPDPALADRFPRSEMLRCIHIGLLCVQENPSERPNMSSVRVMLSSDTVSLPSPSKPGFIFGTSSLVSDELSGKVGPENGKHSSSAKYPPMSPNEVSISDIEPR